METEKNKGNKTKRSNLLKDMCKFWWKNQWEMQQVQQDAERSNRLKK